MLVNMAGNVDIFRTMVIMTLGLEMFDVRIGCCEVIVGYATESFGCAKVGYSGVGVVCAAKMVLGWMLQKTGETSKVQDSFLSFFFLLRERLLLRGFLLRYG